MSRTNKNIFAGLLAVLLCVCIIFTIKNVPNYQNTQPQNRSEMQKPYDTPKDRPNNDIPNEQGEPLKDNINDALDMKREENISHIDREYCIYLGVESLLLSAVIVYLLMSNFNKKSAEETFETTEKKIIYAESVLLLGLILTFGLSFTLQNFSKTPTQPNDQEKTTKKDDVDKGTKITSHTIDLDEYSSNITLTEKGEYTIKGTLDYSLLIDAPGKVTLNLDGVTIKSKETSAIANISTNELVINLIDDTENVLEDGGSSEYDGCLYSNGHLTIKGTGTLKVYGNQEEGEGIATTDKNITIESGNIHIESEDDGINAGGDGGLISIKGGTIFIKANGDGIDSNKNLEILGGTIYTMGSPKGGDSGIDTDDGYSIDGGTVIALGSDMLEAPLKNSKQKSICFTLKNSIAKNTLVTLTDTKGNVIISFTAQQQFKTLIISSDKLKNGTYYLYIGGSNDGKQENYIFTNGDYKQGEKVSINDFTEFTIKETVTNIK